MTQWDETQQESRWEEPPKNIRIRFLLADGRVISEQMYRHGELVVEPRMKVEIQAPDAKYVFMGWSAAVAPHATQSMDYVARYQKIPITATTQTQTQAQAHARGYSQKNTRKKNNLGILAAIIAVVMVIALLAALVIGFKDEIQDLFGGSSYSDSDDDDDRKSSRDDDDDDRAPYGDAPAADAPSPNPPVVEQPAVEAACSHDWTPATCTDPQICRNCGEVQGSARGHDWAMATRTAPKTCVVCGATEGAPIPPPNISVGQQVQYVSDEYYEIEELLNNDELYREEVRTEVYYYYDAYGDIRMVVTAKGNDGIGQYSNQYRRYYYFSDGELLFALFEGQDNHRMYFYDGQLMRWRYQGVGQSRSDAVNEDFTYSDEFLKWESLALQEVRSFGVI